MALRLRLKFQKGILRKSQRSDGLKRSWILVNPQYETISDVVSHLLHAFDLHHTCPNGVLLYMDGFVLPPFASTSILKDKDLICVKRKWSKLFDVIQECREETAYLEHNAAEKQTLNECLQLLPNEELGKEKAFHECENEENGDKKETAVLHDENVPNGDVPVKKRKASKEHKSPKRKRQRQVLHDNDEQENRKEHHGACLQNGDPSKKLSKTKQDHTPEADGRERQRQVLHDNDKQENQKEYHGACLQNGDPNKKLSKTKQDHSPEADERKRQRQVLHDNGEQENHKEHHGACLRKGDPSKKLSKTKQDHTPKADGKEINYVNHKANAVCNGLDESGDGTVTPSGLLNRTGQSRSSKRKKAKRKWRTAEREQQLLRKQLLEGKPNADLGSNKDQNLDTDSHQLQPDEPKDQNLDTGNDDLQADEDSDTEHEIVPVVVRPGYIRFAARGKEEDTEINKEEKEPFSWSGTTIKKKGQKWGREDQSASKWNENIAPCENQSSYKRGESRSPKEKQSHFTHQDSTSLSRNLATQEVQQENASSVDYEKLVPMIDSPVEGDIIAYRLLELSTSFCPELTAYRVGKVSWFDPESQRVMVVPVPQFPLELTKSPNDDTSEDLPDTSCYNKDGSLEIEFQSLVDVRIVKGGEASPAPAVHQKASGVPASSLDPPSGSGKRTEAPDDNDPSTEAPSIRINENGVNNSAPAPAPALGSGRSPGPENGAEGAWDEISAALSAKKAELQEEDNWNKKRPFWPYRALRRSAMGPTLALLRAQNNCQTE